MKTARFLLIALLAFSPLLAMAQQTVNLYVSNDATPVRAFITVSATTTKALVAAQSAGVRTFITQISCTNPTTAVGLTLDILDGGTSIVYNVPCPANALNAQVIFTPPLKMTAATAVNVGQTTTAMTGGPLFVTLNGYTGR